MLLSLDAGPYPFRCEPAVRYGTAPDGTPLYLDLLLPDARPPEPAPAVVYLHGGGWRYGERSAALLPWNNPLLAANGFVTASVTYRLTGAAPFPAQIHDAKAAVRWLRSQAGALGVDPRRIGAWGDSAGGQLAALLGTTGSTAGAVAELEGENGSKGWPSDVQAVVARCAPGDFLIPWNRGPENDDFLRDLFGGPLDASTERLRALAGPIGHAGPDAPPFLLVHGTDDEVVPYEHAERLTAALREHGGEAELHTVDGGHHNLLPDIDAPWGREPWEALGHEAMEFFLARLRC